MTTEEPLTLELIQNELRKAVNEQTTLTARYFVVSDEASDAEGAYKVTFARERHAARSADSKKLSIPAVDDIATIHTEALFQNYLAKEAIKDAVKQSLFSNREKQQTLRTLASSYRMLELGGN